MTEDLTDRAPAVSSTGISVVMPILNEERHLAHAVEAVLRQPAPGPVEVILSIGPSTDGTHEVAEQLAAADGRVHLVDNPSGRTPDALNAALAVASYDVVVRVDGHGILSPDYLETAAQVLQETGAANVGGIMDAVGVTPFERTVATAMKSRLGVGGARFKLGGEAGEAETVYLGVFRREWLRRVGGYDSRFSRAQDWEMNYRIRQAGGLVWFTPQLRVEYRPRGSFRALGRQYRDYGRWRRVVARQHRGSINLRYLAPPTALVAVTGGLLGGLVWQPLWLVPAAYAAAVTVGGVAISRADGPAVMARMPAVLATMHMTWGWGFLTSRVRLEELDVLPGEVQQAPSDGAVA
ncbi:glycosyltransferase family 2 protein [Luteipulveratus sp. YIM 133132]|uniref:glycosyltransferase family 2 protein n=1 Tax=Luteipulveratus flavus TaxID=3031728 RepID=UPI0023B203E4|nr:glycosyltransferase family 2 protein [Luteipulveratus sp. YIM 133132]MDE9366994.1 glycosyltransferase family 2 protein [Luteipulveratus sp. YIM 133132]